jgi:hypothetical protein
MEMASESESSSIPNLEVAFSSRASRPSNMSHTAAAKSR